VQHFYQARQLINKLKRLPDVSGEDLPDATCIICLEEIKKAKKLKCGHSFHLNCLRRWLEQNVVCPTCREKIELDLEERAAQAEQQNRVHRRRLRQRRAESQQELRPEGVEGVAESPGTEKQVEKPAKELLKIDEEDLFDFFDSDHIAF